MGLFIKKPFEALLAEANASGSKSLKRVLGPWSLVALGVGVIIGQDSSQSPAPWQRATPDRPSPFHSP